MKPLIIFTLFGFLFTIIVFIFLYKNKPEGSCLNMVSFIQTSKKITPDFKLKTDGKKIDTIWIYSDTTAWF